MEQRFYHIWSYRNHLQHFVFMRRNFNLLSIVVVSILGFMALHHAYQYIFSGTFLWMFPFKCLTPLELGFDCSYFEETFLLRCNEWSKTTCELACLELRTMHLKCLYFCKTPTCNFSSCKHRTLSVANYREHSVPSPFRVHGFFSR